MALFLLVVQDKYDGDSFGEFIFEEYNEESTEETSTIESSKETNNNANTGEIDKNTCYCIISEIIHAISAAFIITIISICYYHYIFKKKNIEKYLCESTSIVGMVNFQFVQMRTN